MTKHDIAIFGSGSLGTGLAAQAYLAGFNTSLVGRASWINAIRNHGLNLEGKVKTHITENESFKLFSEKEAVNLNLKNDGLIVIGTKTPDVIQVINDYFPIVYNENSRQNILMIQNGLNPEENVKELFKNKYSNIKDHLVGGIVMGIGSRGNDLSNPTLSYGVKSIILGTWDEYTRETQGAISKVMSDLFYIPNCSESILMAQQDEYKRHRYVKAMMNSANVISAVFGAKVGEIADNPFLWESAKRKISEATKLANKEGIDLETSQILKQTFTVYDTIVRKHYASMCQDISNAIDNPGKKLITEIDDLDLAFAKKGQDFEIETPFNSHYGHMMRELTETYNKIVSENPEKAKKFIGDLVEANRHLIDISGMNGMNPLLVRNDTHLPSKVYDNLQETKQKYAQTEEYKEKYAITTEQEKQPIRILMVDDEESIVKSIPKLLKILYKGDETFRKNYNLEFYTASSGQEGIDKVAELGGVECIIADVKMDDIDGVEMSQKIEAEGHKIKVVFYSGYQEEKLRHATRRVKGKVDLISKEYGASELYDAVKIAILQGEIERRKSNYFS